MRPHPRETVIRDAILTFDWHNYGLDNVAEANPEYATHLARHIAVTLSWDYCFRTSEETP